MIDFDEVDEMIAKMEGTELSDWEVTEEGILAMYMKIKHIGKDLVSEEADIDWSWQLVGLIGAGYTSVTEQSVEAALYQENWLKGMEEVRYGVLGHPWGKPSLEEDDEESN